MVALLETYVSSGPDWRTVVIEWYPRGVGEILPAGEHRLVDVRGIEGSCEAAETGARVGGAG